MKPSEYLKISWINGIPSLKGLKGDLEHLDTTFINKTIILNAIKYIERRKEINLFDLKKELKL